MAEVATKYRFEVEVYSAAHDGQSDWSGEHPSPLGVPVRGFFFETETAEEALAAAERAGIDKGARLLGGACLRVVGCEPVPDEQTADRNSEVVRLRARLREVQSRLAGFPGPCATEEEHREWARAFADEPLIKKQLAALGATECVPPQTEGEERAVPEPTVKPVPLAPMQEGVNP